jgi:ATP-dependent DNA helicase RecG
MENRELESLLVDLESDRVERKASLSDPDKIRQAICAFANDLPNHRKAGVLFVGVHDDGGCAGLPITDELLRTLSDVRSDGNTVPFPSMTVQKRILLGCEVAVVLVEPSDAPPVRYRGRAWVRIGPRRAVASPEEERRLTEKRRARDLPFDLHPVASSTLEDLDLDLFRRTSLVTGRDPLQFLPGAYVQFLRVDGMDLSDPLIDGAELSGPLPELLRAVEEKLQAHLETARDLTSGPMEAVHPDYPMVALQQLTRNAILHRTYEGTAAPVRVSWFSDRIEILSPGGPYGLVNRSNFGRPGITDYRNPHLAEAMRNLGYVQKFGVGIALARQALLGNANPPLEFRVEDTHVLAVIRRRN